MQRTLIPALAAATLVMTGCGDPAVMAPEPSQDIDAALAAVTLAAGGETKLTASDAAADDRFGGSVTIRGDLALVGAAGNGDDGLFSGSAYIFRQTGATWSQEAKLTASDAGALDFFGNHTSLSGTLALVGAGGDDRSSGAAYIFREVGTSWTEEAKLTASNRVSGAQFGISTALSGEVAIVGASVDDGAGSVFVFSRTGTTWALEAKLTASDRAAGDSFGEAVSVSGEFVVVGAPGRDDDGNLSGAAYIFRRAGTTWTEEVKLKAGDAATEDGFGGSVSASGDRIIVGAAGDDDAGPDAGSVYIFRRVGTTWSQEAKLTASDAAEEDFFGGSVSISGALAVVGAGGDDDAGRQSGSAYVFRRTGTSWSQTMKLTASDAAGGDSFGNAVSISGNLAIVAAAFADDNGNSSGSAYVFSLPSVENSPPTADAGPDQTVEWTAGGVSVTLDGTASSDPDGDDLTFSWADADGIVVSTDATPTVSLGLGTHTFTLTVSDDAESDTDDVTITVEDTTAPTVTAALVRLGGDDDDDGRFRIEYTCSDACDANPAITTATLNGMAVANGQVVELELEDDDGQEVEYDDGILQIEAPSFELVVTCVDASGNEGTATAVPEFGDDEEDEEDEDEEDEDDDDDDDDRRRRKGRGERGRG